jgi:ABC-2 type transport system ATP-binding protein
VLLSSHALSDLDTTCDYLIILSSAEVMLAGDLDELRTTHRLLIGPRRTGRPAPPGATIISTTDTARQSTWLVRSDRPISDPDWEVVDPTLEEIVLAYLRGPAEEGREAVPASERENVPADIP